MSHDGISVTVDIVLFRVRAESLEVLLIKRKNEPFAGAWALPGGFAEVDENLEESARRELLEETGVTECHLEQLATFGDPGRDPRGRTVSVAFMGIPERPFASLRARTDAAAAEWVSARHTRELAFDHAAILAAALDWLTRRIRTSTLALRFLPRTFTLADAHRTFRALARSEVDLETLRDFLPAIHGLDRISDPVDVTDPSQERYVFDQRVGTEDIHPFPLYPYL